MTRIILLLLYLSLPLNLYSQDFNKVTLDIVDKVTTSATRISMELNHPTNYKTLMLTAEDCGFVKVANNQQEKAVFLRVAEHKKTIFSAWLFPSYNSFSHIGYDISLVDCS